MATGKVKASEFHAGDSQLTFNESGYVDITSAALNCSDNLNMEVVNVCGTAGNYAKEYHFGNVEGLRIWRIKGGSGTERVRIAAFVWGG